MCTLGSLDGCKFLWAVSNVENPDVNCSSCCCCLCVLGVVGVVDANRRSLTRLSATPGSWWGCCCCWGHHRATAGKPRRR